MNLNFITVFFLVILCKFDDFTYGYPYHGQQEIDYTDTRTTIRQPYGYVRPTYRATVQPGGYGAFEVGSHNFRGQSYMDSGHAGSSESIDQTYPFSLRRTHTSGQRPIENDQKDRNRPPSSNFRTDQSRGKLQTQDVGQQEIGIGQEFDDLDDIQVPINHGFDTIEVTNQNKLEQSYTGYKPISQGADDQQREEINSGIGLNHYGITTPLQSGSQSGGVNSKPTKLVKLDDLTPGQFQLIAQIEKYFTIMIEEALKHEFGRPITNLKDETLIERIEYEIKKNLSESIRGFNPDFKQYYNQIQVQFDTVQTTTLKEYLEIRLHKIIEEHARKYTNTTNFGNIRKKPLEIQREENNQQTVDVNFDNVNVGRPSVQVGGQTIQNNRPAQSSNPDDGQRPIETEDYDDTQEVEDINFGKPFESHVPGNSRITTPSPKVTFKPSILSGNHQNLNPQRTENLDIWTSSRPKGESQVLTHGSQTTGLKPVPKPLQPINFRPLDIGQVEDDTQQIEDVFGQTGNSEGFHQGSQTNPNNKATPSGQGFFGQVDDNTQQVEDFGFSNPNFALQPAPAKPVNSYDFIQHEISEAPFVSITQYTTIDKDRTTPTIDRTSTTIQRTTPKTNDLNFDLNAYPPLPFSQVTQSTNIQQSTPRSIERDNDQLIEALRKAQKDRPQKLTDGKLTEVKLINLTSEQLRILKEIEDELTGYIIKAIPSTASCEANQNALIKKLEYDLKSNLTECIYWSDKPQFKKFNQPIRNYFEFSKRSDLQKYLLIKLQKFLRDRCSLPGSESLVRLDNLTPQQYKLVEQLEEYIATEVEKALSRQPLDNLSDEEYHKLIEKLENELKIKLTDSLEGNNQAFSQYYTLIIRYFEKSRIPELKRYLEIELLKKLKDSSNRYVTNKVVLENLTSDQFEIVKELEDYFESQVDNALSRQPLNTLSDTDYQNLIKNLETELKIKLAESLEGYNPEFSNYYTSVTTKFEKSKIPILKKYLEIKITKKLQEPSNRYFSNKVVLENLTPEQFKIVEQLTEYFETEVSKNINTQPTAALTDQQYKDLIDKLETAIKIKLSEFIEGTNPALRQNPDYIKYHNLVVNNFDKTKISSLKKYLQIKVSKKINEPGNRYISKTTTHKPRIPNVTPSTTPRPKIYSTHKPVVPVSIEEQLPKTLSSDQLTVVHKIENNFDRYIEKAIENEIINQHSYVKYPDLLEKLKIKLTANLTECLKVTSNTEFKECSEIKALNLDRTKLIQLQEYLEIKLTKKLQQNLNPYEEIDGKLEQITPQQWEVFKKIEDDCKEQIEDNIKTILSESISQEDFKRIVKKLKEDLKTNITDYINEALEPGKSKYPYNIIRNIDRYTIQYIEKYMEIRLSYKLTEIVNRPTYITKIIRVSLEVTQRQLRIIEQIQHEFERRIEMAIQTQMESNLSKEELFKLVQKLETEYKNAVTNAIFGEYYKQVSGNFDEAIIKDVELYLQIKAIKKVREVAQKRFKIDFNQIYYEPSSSRVETYRYEYQSVPVSQKFQVNYQGPHLEKAEDIKPVEGQHANMVIHQVPAQSGSFEIVPAEMVSTNDGIVETTTEQASIWNRFKSKVSQSAKNIKDKFVG